jgi:cullin 3
VQAEVSSAVRQRVEEDRKHVIEAAIVRIMKTRRVLDYNSIITEVTSHMHGRFVPLAVDIKKRVESLIERDFLERDPSDRTLYRYVS